MGRHCRKDGGMARKKGENGEYWSGKTAAQFAYDWEMATKRLLGEEKVSARVLVRWRKEVTAFRKEQAEKLAAERKALNEAMAAMEAEKAALKERADKGTGRRTSTRTGIGM